MCEPPAVDPRPALPHLVRLSLRARVLALIRGGLSALGLVCALLVGASPERALLAWSVGAILVSIVLFGDPRGRRSMPPVPMAGAPDPESWAQIARTDVLPSTVGVALFTAVALLFDPVLAGLLAGILGGMALMTLVSLLQIVMFERRLGGVLYVERGTKRLYFV